MKITPQNEESWQKWCEFREDQINTFVERLQEILRNDRPNLEISAAVFGDINDARNHKFQNWILWAEKGWVDS